MKGQKSIIRTLTNRSFKANKTRNLIAVFAIVLTTVMFTSLFVLSQSMVENMRNMVTTSYFPCTPHFSQIEAIYRCTIRLEMPSAAAVLSPV